MGISLRISGALAIRRHYIAALAVIFASVVGPYFSLARATVTSIAIQPGTTGPIFNITDLAIDGVGFFILHDSDGRTFYTRWGSFLIDSNGYLVSGEGFQVQGSTSDLKTIGGIPIMRQTAADVWVAAYEFHSDGKVVVINSDGSQAVVGQILLQKLAAPENGLRFPRHLILKSDAIGVTGDPAVPGSSGVGSILSAHLEAPAPQIKILGKIGQFSGFNSPYYASQHVDTDLTIRGRGFFVVRNPTNDVLYATRAGAFFWDASGYLANYAGMRVQGIATDGSIGDVRVVSPATNEIYQIGIDWWGSITAYLPNGGRFPAGRILLRDCAHPDALVKAGFGAYEMTDLPNEWTDYTVPNENGLGQIFAYALDLSQVDNDILAARARMNFFVRGMIRLTENPGDLYITWTGMFIVRDPQSNKFYATRNGAFHFDDSGALVTAQGFRVQGEVSLKGRGDIIIDELSDPTVTFKIDSDGQIVVRPFFGVDILSAIILLQDFADPHALIREAGGLYSNIENALPKYPNGGARSGTDLLGRIESGALEVETDTSIHMPASNATQLVILNCDSGWIEVSSDLRTWQAIRSVSGMDIDGIRFLDSSAATSSGLRFYRVGVPAPGQPTPLKVISPLNLWLW